MSDVIQQIYEQVLSKIASGGFPPGTRVPSESELAVSLGSTRMNVARALRKLREEGVLHSRKRAGTFVSPSLSAGDLRRFRCRCSKKIFVLYSGTHANIHWSGESFEAFDAIVRDRGFQVAYDLIPTADGREAYAGLLKKTADSDPAALAIFPGSDDLFFLLDNNDLLLNRPFPIYVLNRGNDMSRLDFCNTLVMDNHAEGMKMISTLYASGFRRVVCICGHDGVSCEREYWCVRRYEGMSMGLLTIQDRNCHLEKVGALCPPAVFDLMRDPARIENTVFVGMNCLLAARFMEQAAKRGFKAGKNYNIAAFDDHPLYRSCDLTALKVPVREVGEIFADMVTADAWYRKYPLKISLSLSGDWVERSSCRKLTIVH